MRPPALDLPYSPSPETARLALLQTAAEHRFYTHLWVWMAGSLIFITSDITVGFREWNGTLVTLFWGAFVLLHYRRVWRGGRHRFLQRHGALVETQKASQKNGVHALRERLLKGLEGAREGLRPSGQDTQVGLAKGEHQALAMVAWLMDAEPLLASQRSAHRERRRVVAHLARPGRAVERHLCEELLALLDENDRRLRRIEGQAEERQDRVESFLLAIDSACMARRSGGEATDAGDLAKRRVDLLEQALEGPVLQGAATEVDATITTPVASEGDEARFRQEVGLARELQLSILPAEAPHVPGLDVAHLYRPSSELGGDFYDFYSLPGRADEEQRLLVALGDASGHGLDSSMVSSMAKSALYMQVAAQRDLAAAMVELNRMMCDTLGRRRMMTLVLVEIEAVEGLLRWTNAGQLYPLLCRGRKIIELAQPGYPLGVRRKQGFAVASQQLRPGDQLVLLTDGFIEADNGQDIYGWPRLLDVLAQRPKGDARQLIDHLVEDLALHLGPTDPEDDVTLLVIDYRPEVM